jgi:hypothetical protein
MIPMALTVLLLIAPGDGGTTPVRRLRVAPPHATHAAHQAIVPPPVVVYREKRGPGCIDANAIAGAAVSGPDAVDFSLKGGQRVRARLADECPALDYYSGFYLSPQSDGRICADRDSIRTRSGGDCQIDRFRKLEPVPPR